MGVNIVIRNLLAEWPAGERRTGEQVTQEAPRANYCMLRTAEKNGFLVQAPWSGKTIWERTELRCAPYTPKPHLRGRKQKRDASGMWPWTIDDHWARINATPHRVAGTVALRLEGTTRPKGANAQEVPADFKPARRTTREKLLAPMFIDTKSTLSELRKILPALFSVEEWRAPKKGRRQRSTVPLLETAYGLPRDELHVLVTPHGIRSLLLEMQVEPVFAADGELERFAPLDPDAAMREFAALTGEGLSFVEKYHHYMEGRK